MPSPMLHEETYHKLVRFFTAHPDSPMTADEISAVIDDPYVLDAAANLTGAVVTYHQPSAHNRSSLGYRDWFVGFVNNGAFYRCGAYPSCYVYDTAARWRYVGHGVVELTDPVLPHQPYTDTLGRMGTAPSTRTRRSARVTGPAPEPPASPPPLPPLPPTPEPTPEPEPSTGPSVLYVGDGVGDPVVLQAGDRTVVAVIQSVT